ncbi:hypothetical protein Calab_1502 [Caldithrix abyssi DSM 13497]|uniref:Uncharacterized protein n=1 Tax=Caldithrix abyssi DSM 13497 TaxID=880073 RepID=H1XQH6_CALAY|nr:hypothetical protein [Caldithrix abyssi]APF16966.1 hypothetical protein Cabys_215 [Caldithrix abyssi DSM 13497]APF20345.1 hypothetical protein Cabys_3599 [Caldithrix abyssi DSM 13497]EHO40396.1 hypothetical protein Calab_0757 [Caldithrix abyssi DSM 13497]EHO41122.1 hypothetical protein Calab_1502 [Caldithrix abyssi DSM 13497]
MRVSVFNVKGKNETLSYAYVNGAEAVSRYWFVAIVKAWYRSRYVDQRLEKVKLFLSKMLIHSN